MPVRDVEWYSAPRDRVTVLSNRGANGIDGVVSTAVGVALGGGAPTVALVGDLAFLYDAGALLGRPAGTWRSPSWWSTTTAAGSSRSSPRRRRFPKRQFERYWGTPHGADVAAVAAAYGVEVVQVRRPRRPRCRRWRRRLARRRVAVVPSDPGGQRGGPRSAARGGGGGGGVGGGADG